jgi:hypothetical protein
MTEFVEYVNKGYRPQEINWEKALAGTLPAIKVRAVAGALLAHSLMHTYDAKPAKCAAALIIYPSCDAVPWSVAQT